MHSKNKSDLAICVKDSSSRMAKNMEGKQSGENEPENGREFGKRFADELTS